MHVKKIILLIKLFHSLIILINKYINKFIFAYFHSYFTNALFIHVHSISRVYSLLYIFHYVTFCAYIHMVRLEKAVAVYIAV